MDKLPYPEIEDPVFKADGTFGCLIYFVLVPLTLWLLCSCAPSRPKHREITIPMRKTVITPVNRLVAEKVDVRNGLSLTGYRRTVVTMEVEHPLLPRTVKLRPVDRPADPSLTRMFKDLAKQTKARTVRTTSLKVGVTRIREIRNWREYHECHGQAGVIGISYTIWF